MRTFLLNWQWLLSAGLATWFLFVHSPPILAERGALRRLDFFLHLAGAYVVYLACLHNTLYNPFTSKSRHALVGQVGLICGVVGFVLGLVTIANSWSDIDKGFAVGITVGGVLQMRLQNRGYRAIQQYKQAKEELAKQQASAKGANKNGATDPSKSPSLSESELQELRDRQRELLRTHAGCMIGLLVNACGMPAAMRWVDRVGLGSGIVPIAASLGLLTALKASHAESVFARLHLDRKKELLDGKQE